MHGRPLFVALTLNLALLTAAAVVAVTVFDVRTFQDFHLSTAAEELAREARLLESAAAELLGDPQALEALTKDVLQRTGIRVTVIQADGTVAAESERDPGTMDNHARRPEVAEALAGRPGTSTRRSATLGESLVYAAIPLVHDGQVVAVLRTSRTVASARASLRLLWQRSALGAVVVALLAMLVLLRTTRFVTRPITQMIRAAAALRAGELDQRVTVREPVELATLADAFNAMAVELQRRMTTVLRQNALVETIFAGMADGILAIDSGGILMDLNQAAAVQLGIAREAALGRSLSDIIRSREILELIRRAQVQRGPIEEDLTLYGESERHLQVRADVLRDADGGYVGLVVVLHDVTRMRRLETLRRDFAANVSHELKTPITSIKGFVETLRDGALSDPASAQRFLGIVARETDRLDAIIDDLMGLARLEQQEARHEIAVADVAVRGVLAAAIEACAQQAAARSVAVRLDCEGEPAARADAALLERAVVNLVDNAIKYSGAGAEVIVGARRDGQGLVLSVKDRGCGIAPEHLPRIFERFYRVDKARSRDQGGTGLGLAIVKHVAQALGGTVAVDSVMGAGSTFVIRLP